MSSFFKLNLYAEGPNGIIQPTGFYIKDFDNIYISSYAYSGLIKVDTTCRLLRKIPYGTTDEGYKVLPSYTPSSHPYLPPIFIDKKVYIIQNAVERFNSIDKTPVSVVIVQFKRAAKGFH